MGEYIGLTRNCDIPYKHGEAVFEKERFVWTSKDQKHEIVIYYKDIVDIKTHPVIYSRNIATYAIGKIDVYTDTNVFKFSLRHIEDFVRAFYEGKIANMNKKEDFVRTSPMSDEEISKLERLATLRDSGTITKEEFEEQKQLILRG